MLFDFFMTLPGLIIFMGVLIWICALSVLNSNYRISQNKIDEKLKKLKVLNISERYDFKSGINEKKTVIVSSGSQSIYIISLKNKDDVKIPFKDVVSAELKENGKTIIKTSISSQVGRAAVGGLLFGGIGAIIGGTSGNKKENTKITKTYLLINTTNISEPFHQINFIGADRFKESRHWHGILKGIIHKNKIELLQDKKEDVSFYDELLKLNKLLKDGILTQEEFQKCKQKFLKKME